MQDKQKLPENEAKESKRNPSADVDKALQNFNKTVVEPPKRKSNLVSLIFLPIIIGAGLYLMVRLAQQIGEAGEVRSLTEILSNLNYKYLIIALAAMLTVMTLESVKYFIVTHAVTGKFRPLDSIKVGFVGKYYDDITPFSMGGQPMQIVYLHKKGHSAGISSAIILIKYFIQIICWVVICFLIMVLNRELLYSDIYVKEFATRGILIIGGWIGWIVTAMLPLSIIFFAIFPKITNRLLEHCINAISNVSWKAANRKERKTGKSQLRKKMKLVRRKRRWIANANASVEEFRSSFIVMSHKPLHFISLIISCACEQLLSWALPFFIFIAFDKGQTPTLELMLAIMTLNVYTAMAVTVVPTPGNSGLMETVMLAAMNSVLKASAVWVIVAWRMSTYYIYIVVGIFIVAFEFFRNLRRNKRHNKQVALLAEQALTEQPASEPASEDNPETK